MKKVALALAILMIITLLPATNTALANQSEHDLIWEMTEDDVNSFISDPQNHEFLRSAHRDGRPVYSVDTEGGLHLSNRNADWQSVDIKDDWMEAGQLYTIVVEFSSSEPALFRIMNTDSPYSTLSISGEPDTHAVLVYTTGIVEGQRGVRLTTPQGVNIDYTISSIRIYAGGATDVADVASWYMNVPSLHELFSDYFPIGNIMEPGVLNDADTVEMFLHHYNSVTAENAMKPANIAPSRGVWNLSGPERLVDWAIENNIHIHGHTLVWHSQSAPWLTEDENGEPISRAEARSNMEYFISHYVGHFAGRVTTWDVVNEAFTDSVSNNTLGSAWRNNLRSDSPWYIAYSIDMDENAEECPSDYIYDAFVFTRLTDPNAILFYNDFNEESPGKREVIASMTEELNERWLTDPRNDDPERLLIEGLGMQAHYWTEWLDPNDVRDTIVRFAETGARVAITELDIPIGRWNAFGDRTEESLEHQAELFGALFNIFMAHSDYIDSVTLWGRADHQSWRAQGFPLLFDGRLEPKPAFWSIVEVINPELAELGRQGLFSEADMSVDSPDLDEPDVPDELDEDIDFDNIEPMPMPEVTPLAYEPPLTDEPATNNNSGETPPWWAIALIVISVTIIGVALYSLKKK